MTTTLIILGSVIGFITLAFILKYILNTIKKDKKIETEKTIQIKHNLSIETTFIKLETIIELNQELQLIEKDKISTLNRYVKNELNKLQSTPEYIFNSHLNDFKTNLMDFVDYKLLLNSPSIWNKKFNKEITILNYKNNGIKTNNDWIVFKKNYKNELIGEWENEKMKNSLCPPHPLG